MLSAETQSLLLNIERLKVLVDIRASLLRHVERHARFDLLALADHAVLVQIVLAIKGLVRCDALFVRVGDGWLDRRERGIQVILGFGVGGEVAGIDVIELV